MLFFIKYFAKTPSLAPTSTHTMGLEKFIFFNPSASASKNPILPHKYLTIIYNNGWLLKIFSTKDKRPN